MLQIVNRSFVGFLVRHSAATISSPTEFLLRPARHGLIEAKVICGIAAKSSRALSISISYDGAALAPRQTYFWKVKIWCKSTGESPWSAAQQFTMASDLGSYLTSRHPLCRSEIAPRKIMRFGPGHYVVDFGKAAFGYLKLNMPRPTTWVEVHFGERGDRSGVNRTPGGSVRYYRVILDPEAWSKDARIADVQFGNVTTRP